MALRKQDVTLPDVGADLSLWRDFTDLGFAMAGGFGPVPLTFGEIAAFDADHRLGEWDRKALRKMSAAYLEGIDAGKELFCRPPAEWVDEGEEDE